MSLFQLVLLLNVLWFGSAFWYFWLRHATAVKLLVPRSARETPIYKSFSAALPFLGGMNLALTLLSLMVLINPELFTETGERTILLVAFGIAHATQFLVNVPIAKNGGRIGEAYWDVLNGPMLFIFVVDALMCLLNIGFAVVLSMA